MLDHYGKSAAGFETRVSTLICIITRTLEDISGCVLNLGTPSGAARTLGSRHLSLATSVASAQASLRSRTRMYTRSVPLTVEPQPWPMVFQRLP